MTDENSVSLYSADGRELRFRRIASVPVAGSIYAVLAPEEPLPGMRDDMALVFEVTERESGMAAMNIVTDPHIIAAVYDAYGEMTLRETDEKARKKDVVF